jgi:hypothetical protein
MDSQNLEPISRVGTEQGAWDSPIKPVQHHTHDGVNSPLIDSFPPGGEDSQLQYNNDGEFGGIPTATFDDDAGDLTIASYANPNYSSAGSLTLAAADGRDDNGSGGTVNIQAGASNFDGITNFGSGGGVNITGGENTAGGSGGEIDISAGGTGDGPGADIRLTTTDANGVSDYNGGSIILTLGAATGSGSSGKLKINTANGTANFIFDELQDIYNYTFPSVSTKLSTTLYTLTEDVTLANITDGGFHTITVQSPMLLEGRVFKVTAWGLLSTDASGPGQLRIDTGPGTTEHQNLVAGLDDVAWKAEAYTTIRTEGVSGTLVTDGYFEFLTSPTGSPTRWPISELGTFDSGSIDTTSVMTIGLGVDFTISDPDNSITCKQLIIESLN